MEVVIAIVIGMGKLTHLLVLVCSEAIVELNIPRLLLPIHIECWQGNWIGLPLHPHRSWLHKLVLAEWDMRVQVSTGLIQQLVLCNGEVNEIWIALVVPRLEGFNQYEGVSLNIKAILGDIVVVPYEFDNPSSPIPQLHGNLLILRPGVIEM